MKASAVAILPDDTVGGTYVAEAGLLDKEPTITPFAVQDV